MLDREADANASCQGASTATAPSDAPFASEPHRWGAAGSLVESLRAALKRRRAEAPGLARATGTNSPAAHAIGLPQPPRFWEIRVGTAGALAEDAVLRIRI